MSQTGAMEGQYAIKHKKNVSLSEQELVDCALKAGGCEGGYMEHGFEYAQQHGISTEGSYKYKAKRGTCNKGTDSGVKVVGFVEIEHTEEALKQAVGE